jgi:hypothetical protein
MAKRYTGSIYSFTKPPKDAFYHLTKEQLLGMNLIGIPVHVEHHDTPVGRIVSASMSDASADVQWEMNDCPAGWTAEQLMALGEARELSLKHIKHANGSLTPVEVSLVVKGARPESLIHIKPGELTTVKETLVLASAMAEVTPAAEAPAPVDAAAPVETIEPPAKVQKLDVNDPTAFIHNISTKVTDKDTLQNIVDFIAQTMEKQVNTTTEMEKIMAAKEALEAAVNANKESSKTVVTDIVQVLSQLYNRFAPNAKVNEAGKAEFASLLLEKPSALEFAQPLLVAASAIAERTAHIEKAAQDSQIQAQMQHIQSLQSKLNVVKKMNAPISVQPNWTPAATPMVAVAASAQAPVDPLASIQLPDILKNMTKFSGGSGRVDAKGQPLNGNFLP